MAEAAVITFDLERRKMVPIENAEAQAVIGGARIQAGAEAYA